MTQSLHNKPRLGLWVVLLINLTVCAALLVNCATKLAAQPAVEQAPGPPEGGPPVEMIAACAGKAAGATCSAEVPQRGSVQGTCFAPNKAVLACRPGAAQSRLSGPPLANRQQQGDPIVSTRANTAAILCSKATDAFNTVLGLRSVSSWSCADGQRTLKANGVPDHSTGKFPGSGNPNRISPQTVTFSASLNPVARSGAGVSVKVPGFALNGIKLDPATAGRCMSTVSSPRDCSLDRGNGEWMIEALGQNLFNFGVDANNAHVQPDGAYHYHGIPEGMLSAQAKAGKAMALIGWAVDGFPIYGRFGPSDPAKAQGPVRVMRSSYQLKDIPDSGRPSAGLLPMGAFVQDYRFVKGSGDLDECNGRFAATPEFPNGIYHYYVTDTYPYVQRCVKGTPSGGHEKGPPR